MRLIQFSDERGAGRVGAVQDDGQTILVIRDGSSVRDLALAAHRRQINLAGFVSSRLTPESLSYDRLIRETRLLPPLSHPDPARCLVTGTGLTHLGSAQSRDAMHVKLQSGTLTDSMKMFKLGLEGGKPAPGEVGVAPEWFYKGDGGCIVAPEQPIELPAFAEDGGEESEIVGLYVIADDGQPLRVGFALGNEFSDHKLEMKNYLYLAHSKLRQCSFGPELLTGDLPADIRGEARVVRKSEAVWSGEFLTGEANMSHTIANLEHHHFKYPNFRRPGDIHVHYFGAAVLSCLSGFAAEPGDRFELEVPLFGRPLRNTLVTGAPNGKLVKVKAL